MNPITKTYRYLVDWMNSKGEMVQNTIPANSMQDAMNEIQVAEGMNFSNSGSGKPRFVNITLIEQDLTEAES
ncbi:MAG: hypothetical protein ACJ0A2_03380 [Alphaproteobacteria bacterium]|nr:hypothetical protein [Rhodobiaceae bacterium]MDC0070466.1 hypothetical protein [Rhodobiaceae bacterium]MDC0184798.1 hypothetical protein [Rhodobiaceae bacterium]PDH51005.1 MAG: hypothetical protein CNC74_02985 [alpha proteobacterium MED-G09]